MLCNQSHCACTEATDPKVEHPKPVHSDGSIMLDVTCNCTEIPRNIPLQTVSLTLIGLKNLDNSGTIFRRLSFLRALEIKDGTFILLFNNSLEGLNNISKLSIIDGHNSIVSIDLYAFQHLQNIFSIRFEKIVMLVKTIAASLPKLGSSLRDLTIICDGKEKPTTEILNEKIYKLLEHFHITNLTICQCHIAAVQSGFSKYLQHLVYLNVSQNFISGNFPALNEFILLNNLVILDFGNQVSKKLTTSYKSNRNTPDNTSSISDFAICRLPPNLTHIYYQHTQGFARSPCRAFFPNNNLRFLNLFKTHVPKIGVRGLNALEYLDLQSALGYFSRTSLHNLPSLQTLLIGNNDIGSIIDNDINGTLFADNVNLISLDIAGNSIQMLPEQLLHSIRNVQMLNLSNNHLKHIELNNFRDIQMLNISRNDISHVTGDFMNRLNTLSLRKKITVDFTNNPISTSRMCCAITDFIDWSKHSSINVHNWQRYQCIMDNKKHNFINLSSSELGLQCNISILNNVISLTVTLLVTFILIIGGVVLYKKRWCIRAYIYSAKRYIKLKNEQDTLQEYEYSAFVAYHENDGAWVRNRLMRKIEDTWKLNLCIHQRDFIPGEHIEENIYRGIENSRRVILVISNSFIESSWCMMELRLARQTALDRGYDVVIPIILEEVQYDGGGRVMLNVLKRNTYLEWPRESLEGQTLFWHRLHGTLHQKAQGLNE